MNDDKDHQTNAGSASLARRRDEVLSEDEPSGTGLANDPSTKDVDTCSDEPIAPDGDGAVSDGSSDEDDVADDPEANAEALKDQLLRALAETENLRKRAEREREEAAKYAITSLARDIVSVADNLQRALESVPAQSDDSSESNTRIGSLRDGIEMTRQEFETVLARHGIERLEPLGEAFDHNFHQAMFEVEHEEYSAGTVVQVLQAGYRIRDRLLRPAMVGVAKKARESGDL